MCTQISNIIYYKNIQMAINYARGFQLSCSNKRKVISYMFMLVVYASFGFDITWILK